MENIKRCKIDNEDKDIIEEAKIEGIREIKYEDIEIDIHDGIKKEDTGTDFGSNVCIELSYPCTKMEDTGPEDNCCISTENISTQDEEDEANDIISNLEVKKEEIDW